MTEIKHSEREHSIVGASGASRWVLCYGSVALNATMPDRTNKGAREGTFCHELSEWAIPQPRSKMNLSLDKFIKLPNLPNQFLTHEEFEIDEEMLKAAKHYSRLTHLLKSILKPGYLEFIEKRVALNKVMYGTGDYALRGYRKKDNAYIGIILDLKYGKMPVEAVNNWQAAYYAAAFEHSCSPGKPFDEVWAFIYQPRAGGLKSWRISKDILAQKKEELIKAAKVAIAIYQGKIDPIYNPSEAACEWCDAKVKCPEYQAALVENSSFDMVEFENQPLPPASLSDDIILKIASNKSALIKYINDVEEYAIKRMQGDDPIKNAKLKVKKGNKKLIKPTKELEEFCRANDIELYQEKPIALGALKKALEKKGKKDFPEEFITRNKDSMSVEILK